MHSFNTCFVSSVLTSEKWLVPLNTGNETKKDSFLSCLCLFVLCSQSQKAMKVTHILSVLLWFFCIYAPTSFCANVTYDHRALVIDGKRRVLVSGSIHYPRSTPEVLFITLFLCLCNVTCKLLFPMFFKFGVKKGGVCCCRCGQTSFKSPKKEDLM